MEYKQFSEDFARRAGAIIKKNFMLGMEKKWKSDNSPVTETDLAINSMLIEEVREQFPLHGVKSEEKDDVEGHSEYTWVCDPVDGTIPFSHGIPLSTFSLALTKNGESVLGVVYDPFGDRFFGAEKGEGAFLNGARIQVSGAKVLANSAAGCEMFDWAKYDINDLVKYLRYEENVKVMSLCSVIYSSMLVAAGEFAFTIFPHSTAHDAASVKIIVEEAGGKVTDLFGRDQRYDRETNGFIASNRILHGRLVELSKKMAVKR